MAASRKEHGAFPSVLSGSSESDLQIREGALWHAGASRSVQLRGRRPVGGLTVHAECSAALGDTLDRAGDYRHLQSTM